MIKEQCNCGEEKKAGWRTDIVLLTLSGINAYLWVIGWQAFVIGFITYAVLSTAHRQALKYGY